MSNHDKNSVQIVGYRVFIAVWVGLLLLTAVTVAVARLNLLAGWSVLGSLFIASCKAALVLVYFMHIKWEPRFLRVMLFVALAALSIMLMLTFTDVGFRG
jgi:cytochrome c oxidase subunit IV